MKNYYIEFCGLSFDLRVPWEIEVSRRMTPFLVSKPNSKSDYIIELKTFDNLPSPSSKAEREGFMAYEYSENKKLIFHYDDNREFPYAVTEFSKNGYINLNILKGFSHYFIGTSGIFNRIGVENIFLSSQGFLLHSSFVKYKEKAILFVGPSGVGKSTQAGLWEKFRGAEIINGDRTVIRRNCDGWMAYGSPYAGTSGIYKNERAPVKALVVLKQSEQNKLRKLTSVEAFSFLYPEINAHRSDERFMKSATDLVVDFADSNDIYLLKCRPDESAVKTLEEGIFYDFGSR